MLRSGGGVVDASEAAGERALAQDVAAAVGGARRRRPHLRVVTRPPLRIADVALFYGSHSGGIRTYLEAKASYAARSGAFEHHLIVPGPRERHLGRRHELRAVRVAASNGYRAPLGSARLKATLRDIRPDVVLLHDPFWAPRAIAQVAREIDAAVVAVHHAGVDLNATAMPGPDRLWRPVIRSCFRRAYGSVDAIMSVVDTLPDGGRAATLELRLGVDPAFRPRPEERRGDHVVYVGRLSREKGVHLLLDAAARSPDPWPLTIVGTGPRGNALAAHARRLGIAQRVSFRPYVVDRDRLAHDYATARVVCMPGRHETFGLVALEAAACGTRIVADACAPSVGQLGTLVDTFASGDVEGLGAAIERARSRPRDLAAAASLAKRSSWPAVFEAELSDLERLAR
ncbi:MAG: glycosyltransferase [Solirubrobacteraceae bacterium]